MELLNREECALILTKYFNDSNNTIVEFHCAEIEGCGGFLGVPVKIQMKVKNQAKEVIEIQFFAKCLPRKNPSHSEVVSKTRVFYKETNIYKCIFERLNNFIDGNIIPKYYHSRPDDIVVLEDLSQQGFCTKDPSDFFDLEHCEQTLNALAKLHAASIILEDRCGQSIDNLFPNYLFETVFVNDKNHPGFQYIRTGTKAIECILKVNFSNLPVEVHNAAMDLVRDVMNCGNKSQKYRNVLTHGDLWANNIMFKYEQQGNENKLVDVRLVDFQLMRYTTAAFDVLVLLHLSTTKAFREENLEQLLQFYYERFGAALARGNVNVNDIITWSEFRESVNEVTPHIIGLTALYLHWVLIPKDSLQEVMKTPEVYDKVGSEDRNEFVLGLMKSNVKYRNRVWQSVFEIVNYISLKFH